MPKKGKKGKGKKGKSKAVGPPVNILRDNYKLACKLIGEKPDAELIAEFDEAMSGNIAYTQLCIGDRPLGPAGVRCIAEGIKGIMTGMQSGPYLQLSNLQLWNCGAMSAGAIAMGGMLSSIKDKELQLTLLDLSNNNIGVEGMAAIGAALAVGGNTSLVCLKLDFNPDDKDNNGVGLLCKGLRTNTTLKKLSMEYCEIGPLGGRYLAQLLSFSGSALEKLCLLGNKISSKGLKVLGQVLKRNTKLQFLDLSDNDIGDLSTSAADIEALHTLALSLTVNKTLTTLILDMNNIGELGAEAMDPHLKHNKTLGSLLVDPKLPRVLFDSLTRAGSAKKGKKGKKKKKK